MMSIMLSGCVALPVPGYYISARQNIGDTVPGFIIAGETSRTDVLITLGHPDYATDDRSEFIYLVVRSQAGVWMTYGWREYTYAKTEFRELDLTFDEHGVVSNSIISTGVCNFEEHSVRCGRILYTEHGAPRLADGT